MVGYDHPIRFGSSELPSGILYEVTKALQNNKWLGRLARVLHFHGRDARATRVLHFHGRDARATGGLLFCDA